MEIQSTQQDEEQQNQFGMTKHELREQIEGYCFPLLSPFGKVLSLSADLYSSQKSIYEVENNLSSFVRPFISYSTQHGSFSSDVKALTKYQVLESLELHRSSHECIFTSGESELEPYMQLAQLFTDQLKNEKSGVKINLYIPNSFHYSGVLPWLNHPAKVRIISLDTDANGIVKPSTLVSAVLKNVQKAKIQVIQLSGLSTLNRQSIDLKSLFNQIDAFRIEFPKCQFYGVIEGGNLLNSYSTKERMEALNNFDLSVFSAQKLLGGLQASSFIIFRKEAFEQLQKFGGNSIIKQQEEISAISYLRSSQLLQFYNREKIQDRIQYECELNSKLFFEEVQQANERLQSISVLNKIDLLATNSFSNNGRYSLRLLTETSAEFLEREARQYPVLLSKQASQLLHDLFGIMAKSTPIVKSTNNFRFTSTPSHIIDQYGLVPIAGFQEMKLSPLDIDIHFLMSPADVIYLVAALEQLVMNGTKLLKYYNKTNFKPKSYRPIRPNISFEAYAEFEKHPLINEEEKSIQYSNQLAEAIKILKQPQNYFSMNENWTDDRTTVFPLDALFQPYPIKSRITVPKIKSLKENQQSDDVSEDTDTITESERFISISFIRLEKDERNSKIVQEARNLILKIRNNNNEPDEENDGEEFLENQHVPRLQRNQSILFQPLLPLNQDQAEDPIEKLKIQIRYEIEQEYKLKLLKSEQLSLSEQMKVRENRINNLKTIFNFYANLVDVLDESDKPTKGTNSNNINNNNSKQMFGIAHKQQIIKQNEANLQMGANKYFKFCHDFNLIEGQLDIKTLYILFNKVADTSNSNTITRLQQIKFKQFQLLVEKMAAVYFGNNDYLYTQIDKYEHFARLIGLDDPNLFKPKLKSEGLVHFSFVFHDKYQLFSAGPFKDKFYSDALNKMNDQSKQQEYQISKQQKIERRVSNQLINRTNENQQDWVFDNSTMDQKHLYSEQDMTQNDVFSEVALLSSVKQRKYFRGSKINNENQHPSSISLLQNNSKQSLSQSKILTQSEINDFPSINSNSNAQNGQQLNIQQSNSSNSQKQLPILSMHCQVPSQSKAPLTPDLSTLMKQQVLNRAKQIANIQKMKQSQKMHSIGDISSWNLSTEQDSNQFYAKSPSSKQLSKQEGGSTSFDQNPHLIRHQRNISKIAV